MVVVDKDGKVTAVKKGKATIKATVDGKTYKCNVTVNGIHDINTNDVESPYFDTVKVSVKLETETETEPKAA